MGAVGINFGSATGGSGFDVTATVASIVGNLQQVETPWNTQLASLKADDTALTSIGSDLSALSTSLLALTDFQGVTAQKQGSSSDSSVLTLTNAAATATAGNHSVTVSQLAQTASDYSDAIASTDKVGGALTIQVGTGAATTIPVISGKTDTLATYAAAINYADIGVTASIISDTTGSRLSLVSKTSGVTGALTVTQGGTVATATAATTAAVSVAPTATNAATNTFTLAAATDQLSGILSYAIGSGTAATVDLGSTPLSLPDAAAALNADTAFHTTNGLVASVSGSSLVITGATDATGAAKINSTGSTLTTTTPAATYAGLADVNNADAASVASTATTAATNTFNFAAATNKVSGIFSYAIGTGTATTVDLGSTPLSLTDAAAALNADPGFHTTNGLFASVSGSSLVITGSTGTSGSATIDTTRSSLISTTTPASTIQINTGLTAQNAILTVDGISINSASNTVSTAIPGVTFQILSKSTIPVQVEIVNDSGAVETAVSTFVSAYNKVLGDLTTQEGKDSSGNPEPLYGNSIIAKLQSALSLALTAGTASGSVNNLYQLGISVTNTGTLKLDSSALDSMLNSHYSDVVGFMQNSGSFGQKLKTTLDYLGNTSPMGAITLALAANSSQETTFNNDITAQNALIAKQKASLTAELNLANEILQAIPQQLNTINELYSAMSGYNTKTG